MFAKGLRGGAWKGAGRRRIKKGLSKIRQDEHRREEIKEHKKKGKERGMSIQRHQRMRED